MKKVCSLQVFLLCHFKGINNVTVDVTDLGSLLTLHISDSDVRFCDGPCLPLPDRMGWCVDDVFCFISERKKMNSKI